MTQPAPTATHCAGCADLERRLANMAKDLECAQTNFRVTNQAYCKLDVETRELRGSSFVQSARVLPSPSAIDLLKECRSELSLVAATPKAFDRLPITGPAILRLIPRLEAFIKECEQ